MHLGWEHEAVSLPGAMGLQGGRIQAVTALDGAGHAAKPACWQGLESCVGALCQNPLAAEGREEAALSRDLLRLPGAVRGRGDGDGSPQPHATCTPLPATVAIPGPRIWYVPGHGPRLRGEDANLEP